MTDAAWFEMARAFNSQTKPQLVDYLVAHGTIYPNRAGLQKWSKQDLVNSATDHAMRALADRR